MFRDEVEIEVSSGAGGDGCIAFRREKYIPHGGPNGGDGGDGGDVWIVASRHLHSLLPLERKRRWKAPDGEDGRGSQCSGKSGDDLIIEVPVGTIVRDAERKNVLRDLAHDADRVRICKGGKGGRGNQHFASAVEQTPRRAEKGVAGERRRLLLELKLIADVGLVGMPNAGKSTLLAAISAARPKIADYPFTTLYPVLGTVDPGDYQPFVVADLPGLIEGAHEGVGLGDRFLRHVERTRVLVHVVDVAPVDGSDPVESYATIRRELAAHPAGLADRPEIIAANKIDLLGAVRGRPLEPEGAAALALAALAQAARPGTQVHGVSAATGYGLTELVRAMATFVRPKEE